jgi:flagellar hook-associated protein 2
MAVTTDYVNKLGAGSGLDTKAIVTVMVDSEKASKQASIDRQTVSVDAKISSMALVKSALTTMQSAFSKLDDKNDFNFSALSNSSPTNIYAQFDGTAALTGSFAVVVSQLAQSEIRQSTARSSASADLNSGSAYAFTIQTGSGATLDVSLAAGAVSLDSAATAINALDAGYTAWVVETSTGNNRLLLQGVSGSASAITIVDNTNLFGLNTNSNKKQTAQNAEGTMNGVSISRSSNVINDLVPGLSMEFSKVDSSAVIIGVTQDVPTAASAITAVVNAYNAFEKVLKNETSVLNSAGDEGALKSDSSVRGIREAMRKLMTDVSSTPGATITSMASIGVEVQRSGEFKINSVKLASALSNNFSEVTKMFTADTNNQSPYGDLNRGVAGDLVSKIRDYLAATGVVKARETAYSKTQTTLKSAQTALDTKMEKVEARYTSQFSTMNKIMDEMKSMQDYLEQQLDNLPYTSKNN